MSSHDELKQLALDHVYGLLDGPQAAAARAQLDSPEGRAAVEEAERFRTMLSAAARLQFPEARFAPPTAMPQRHHRTGNGRWIGWVVAASMLLAMAIPASATWLQGRTLAQRAELARAAATEAQAAYARGLEKWKSQVVAASAAQQSAMTEYNTAASAYSMALQTAQSDLKAKQFNVVVSGPAAITPGAPNYFQVETRNTGGQPIPARVVTRVVDQNQRVVYEPPPVESQGAMTLKLPVDLPLTPDRDLALEIAATARDGGKAELQQKLALAAPVYLAHLTTDKPLYQPGETVRFRALLLDRFKLEPPKENLTLTLTVLDPSGAELVNQTGISPSGEQYRGLAAGEYVLGDAAAGGEYSIRLRESAGRTPEQVRRFLVNKYQPARLEKKLEFTRKSYGPGDEVVAACTAARVSGPLTNQPVAAAAQVDGVAVPVEHAPATDANGAVLVKFRLPAKIDRGSASVSIAFTDGGAQETLLKPVPVVLKKLWVEFFPEGGDLIAGVPNRVYLQARTPLGKPAEMKARLVDDQGATITNIATLSDDQEPGINQGQAQFSFTPSASGKYRLMIDKPEGITSEHILPAAKPAGIVLNTGVGVGSDRDPLPINLTNVGPSRTVIVGVYARGRLLDHQRLTLAPLQSQALTLQPSPGFGGVTRVTVFEEKGDGPARQLVPLAERLVFRQPSKRVELSVVAEKKAYTPGAKAAVTVAAKDETGKAIPAMAMLGVVNQSVVVMADEKSFRSMPTHFLLTGEVEKAEDLEHVDVLLGAHAKSATALDLLLGVQGWRRFVEQGPELPPGKNKAGEQVARAALPKMQVDSFQYVTKTVSELKRPELEAARTKAEAAGVALQAAMAAPTVVVDQNEQFQRAAVAAVRALIEHYDFAAASRALLRNLSAWVGVIAGFAALAAIVARLVRSGGNYFRFAASGAAVAVAAGFVWFSLDTPSAESKSPARASTLPVSETGDPLSALAADGANNQFWGQAVTQHWELFNPNHEIAGRLIVGQELQDAQYRSLLAAQLYGVDGNGNANNVYFLAKLGEAEKSLLHIRDTEAGDVRFGGTGGIAKLDYKPGQPKLGMPFGVPKDNAAAPAALAAPDNDADRGAAIVMAPKPAPMADGRKGGEVAPGMPPASGAPNNKGRRGQPTGGVEEAPAKRADELADAAKKLKDNVEHKQQLGRREIAGQPRARADLPPAPRPVRGKAGEFEANQPVPAPDPVNKPEDRLRVGLIRLNSEKDLAEMAGRQFRLEVQVSPFVVREFAHVHKPAADGIRDDFTETVYWHPALMIPGEGATIRFDLSDAVNRYQILAAAHTLDGRLGAAKGELTARKPMSVEPKLPVEITAGDRIDVPVAISNETDQPREVKLSLESPGLVSVGEQPKLTWTQPGNSRSRRLFGFRPLHVEGMARLRLALAGDDAIEMRLPVVPEGFPIQGQIANELRSSATHGVTLPATWIPGTLKCEVAVFPTPLADLQRGLEGLLREPGGCFEQTSTTNYPNTLILDYLRETNQASPEAVARAKGMLERGYQRLVAFEVPAATRKEGYEWFGQAPAHEALTAYGLLQFRDMARVTDVDPAMIARTRQFLLARRDGQGGFQRNQRALDHFGRASEMVTNAYIVWAVTESGKDEDVTKELERLQAETANSQDPYFLALVANSLLNRDQTDAARRLLERLSTLQLGDGSFGGVSKSITGSQGNPLKIETTALAVLGWLKANQPADFGQPIRKAVQWIGQQRQGQGNFGPTQSTIMALKALVAFAKANKQPPEAGKLILRLGDQVIAQVDYAADRQDAIVVEVPNPEQWLKAGDNSLTLSTTGKNFYPYTIAWSYHTLQPPSAQGCAVQLTTQLDRSELAEGESTRLNVTLNNVSRQGQGMAVAIVGLPAGLKLPDDFKQLRDLARVVDGKPGTIGYWELRGRELILYWRDLAPDAKVELHLDVIANIPGRYRGPASRAYLYYDPDAKHWAAPLSTVIAAK